VNGVIPAALRLAPEQAGAARRLARFASGHTGVTVIAPDYRDPGGPWRAEIREGSVPGGDATTQAILTARLPAELLGKLEDLFRGAG